MGNVPTEKKTLGRRRHSPRRVTALGEVIARYRARRGMSLAELAAALGLPPRTLAQWESDGRAPGDLARGVLLAHRPRIPGIVGALDAMPATWSRRAGATRT